MLPFCYVFNWIELYCALYIDIFELLNKETFLKSPNIHCCCTEQFLKIVAKILISHLDMTTLEKSIASLYSDFEPRASNKTNRKY